MGKIEQKKNSLMLEDMLRHYYVKVTSSCYAVSPVYSVTSGAFLYETYVKL